MLWRQVLLEHVRATAAWEIRDLEHKLAEQARECDVLLKVAGENEVKYCETMTALVTMTAQLDALKAIASDAVPEGKQDMVQLLAGVANHDTLRQALLIVRAQRDTDRKALVEAQRLYYELLLEVSNKWPNETRHETALRYIQERERGSHTSADMDAALANEGDAK